MAAAIKVTPKTVTAERQINYIAERVHDRRQDLGLTWHGHERAEETPGCAWVRDTRRREDERSRVRSFPSLQEGTGWNADG